MRYTFFPGCALSATALSYAMSFWEIARVLDVDMPELGDWNCCGATCFQTLDEVSSLSLSGRNLALAERNGSQEIVTPCASCFAALRKANHYLARYPDLQQKVEAALTEVGLNYGGGVQVRHLLDVLVTDVGLDAIKAKVTQPLTGLKVACYYGCLLTRPPTIAGAAHAEYPVAMDNLMAALGAEPLDWSSKTDCCGTSFAVARPDLVMRLTGKILANAADVGAEAVVAACPLCQTNLDMHQGEHAASGSQGEPLPVLYFTELMGVAFGLRPAALGLTKHLCNPEPLLHRHNLLNAGVMSTA